MRQIGHAVKEDMMKASYENYLKRVRDFPLGRDEQIKKRNPLYFQGYMETRSASRGSGISSTFP